MLYTTENVQNTERFQFALGKLASVLEGEVKEHRFSAAEQQFRKNDIIVGLLDTLLWKKHVPQAFFKTAKAESYLIYRKDSKSPLFILGKDESGLLYACEKALQHNLYAGQAISLQDAPEMVLRGTCIGLQKTAYLPGRDVYEYPYTEELFPWFYDKELWVRYLDMLLENRYNTLYLWNGHPFSSLVKLKDYPYALEVDEATFAKNEEMYRFLTAEANKRGIWIIQMFYNIILPKPFAEKHGLKTQERNRVITPLIADYTRQSIAAFVEKYPNVGLLITLGEAMEGVGQDDIDWFTKTILPGVKEGLNRGDSKIEPPIILRAHDTDAPAVMKEALPIYKNLYTMAKYNGEALTTYTPRGKWAELHQNLGKIGTVHIQNIHILANLEPFRYAAPDFIQQSVRAMHYVHLSNGIHIYPQASYWDWPYAADKVEGKLLLQLERDWMWYKAWARYAWKASYDKNEDQDYWASTLADYYGITRQDGIALLGALNEVGEISPKILRRFGITDGNRQTSSLGMLMTQLINPYRYGLFTLLYESEAPDGEMIIDYAEKEFKGIPHHGETPIQVANEIVAHAQRAQEAVKNIQPGTKNKEELKRLLHDIKIHEALAQHYSYKVKAATQILQYKYTKDISSLQSALPALEKSVLAYSELADLTKNSYRYANSMQTKQRKIPMRGVDASFKHWTEMLPVFETELANFKYAIDSLKNSTTTTDDAQQTLTAANVQFLDDVKRTTLKKGAKLYADQELVVTHLPDELVGLQSVLVNATNQKQVGTSLRFEASVPVKVLVGYYNSPNKVFAPKPVLEIDASANDYGQAETKVRNALRVQYMPMIDVHTYSFPAGKNELKLPKGEAVILGFVHDTELKHPYNADVDNQGDDVDDLFGYYKETKL